MQKRKKNDIRQNSRGGLSIKDERASKKSKDKHSRAASRLQEAQSWWDDDERDETTKQTRS